MKEDTIFIDLDGTLVEHNYKPLTQLDVLLPGAMDKLKQWQAEGKYIVLTTARNSFSEIAEIILRLRRQEQFEFNHIIWGLPSGKRYLINDRKYPDEDKAFAINIERNKGLGNVTI